MARTPSAGARTANGAVGWWAERQAALRRAFLAATAVFVALGAGWYFGTRAWHRIAALEEFRVFPGDLELPPVPWLDREAFLADVRRTDPSGILRGGCSYFTPDLAARVAAAYEASPWVRRVQAVRRRFPNRLEIRLSVREPFAEVRWPLSGGASGGRGEGRAVVDRSGIVLSPRVYRFPPEGLGRPPILLERRPGAPPQEGGRWACEEVAAALALLRYLEERPELRRLEMTGLHVRTEGGLLRRERLCLVLRTERGPDILWGLPPLASGPGTPEVDTATKAGRLIGILRHLDRLPPMEYIDLRNDLFTLKQRETT